MLDLIVIIDEQYLKQIILGFIFTYSQYYVRDQQKL
jgi:hypothetical protein